MASRNQRSWRDIIVAARRYERRGDAHNEHELEIEGSVNPETDREGLLHNALEQRLRIEKWKSLRKSERTAMTAEQVVLTPEERSRWLKDFYVEALSKGELKALDGTSGGAATQAVAGISWGRAENMEKGATKLKEIAGRTGAEVGATGVQPKPGDASRLDPMEQVLAQSIAIGESDLETLAAERAKTVRAYLIASGKVEAERMFLADSALGGVKAKGSRVYLQLR